MHARHLRHPGVSHGRGHHTGRHHRGRHHWRDHARRCRARSGVWSAAVLRTRGRHGHVEGVLVGHVGGHHGLCGVRVAHAPHHAGVLSKHALSTESDVKMSHSRSSAWDIPSPPESHRTQTSAVKSPRRPATGQTSSAAATSADRQSAAVVPPTPSYQPPIDAQYQIHSPPISYPSPAQSTRRQSHPAPCGPSHAP
jgi:hypothetical protein